MEGCNFEYGSHGRPHQGTREQRLSPQGEARVFWLEPTGRSGRRTMVGRAMRARQAPKNLGIYSSGLGAQEPVSRVKCLPHVSETSLWVLSWGHQGEKQADQ